MLTDSGRTRLRSHTGPNRPQPGSPAPQCDPDLIVNGNVNSTNHKEPFFYEIRFGLLSNVVLNEKQIRVFEIQPQSDPYSSPDACALCLCFGAAAELIGFNCSQCACSHSHAHAHCYMCFFSTLLLLLLWLGTITLFAACGCVYMNYIVLFYAVLCELFNYLTRQCVTHLTHLR